jgi:hypothetical protein
MAHWHPISAGLHVGYLYRYRLSGSSAATMHVYLFSMLWRACNLTSFSPCLTGSVDYLFASRHKGPRFKSPGGYLCETGISPVSVVSLQCKFSEVYVLRTMCAHEATVSFIAKKDGGAGKSCTRTCQILSLYRSNISSVGSQNCITSHMQNYPEKFIENTRASHSPLDNFRSRNLHDRA